jgi:hypothetical protein
MGSKMMKTQCLRSMQDLPLVRIRSIYRYETVLVNSVLKNADKVTLYCQDGIEFIKKRDIRSIYIFLKRNRVT